MKDYELIKEMGTKMKAIRKSKKISLRKLAPLVDLDYSHICRIENGQADSRISTLKRIADILMVDVKEFL